MNPLSSLGGFEEVSWEASEDTDSLRESVNCLFRPDLSSLRENSERLDLDILEKYGDNPEWLKITGYRESNNRSEILLNLKGKDYWFPLSRSVYESFVSKIVNENRGVGLRYLQGYIRRYRQYKERWPSKEYTNKNKLPRSSFIKESIYKRSIDDIASRTGITKDVVEAILSAYFESNTKSSEIAKQHRLSQLQVESVINLVRSFEQTGINDSLINSIASGDLDVDEAIKSLGSTERKSSKDAFRKLRSREAKKSVSIPGENLRSPKVRITSQSI